MRAVAQGIEKQYVEAAQPRQRSLRNLAVIRKISGAAEAEPENRVGAVLKRDRLEPETQDFKRRLVDQIYVELGNRGAALSVIEYVGKNAFDHGKSLAGSIDRNTLSLVVIKRANVVESENMVGMPVGVDDCVEARRGGPQNLRPEVRR